MTSAGRSGEAETPEARAADSAVPDRAASASLARVLLACGKTEEARPFVLDGNDPVLAAGLAVEGHEFREARRLLDQARSRDPFDPRAASARGRLSFLEKKFPEAVADLLEAALLSPDGLPDARDIRFLRAARSLAPERIPEWKEAAAAAAARLETEARRWAPGLKLPERVPALVRALIARAAPVEGVLDRARRLAEVPGLAGIEDHALVAAAARGELRRLAPGSILYRTGDPAAQISLVLSGRLRFVRETPVGPQAMGEARAGDFAGEEAFVGARRTSEARADGAVALLGFSPDFFSEDPARAAWLRHLRLCLARRLGRLDDLFSGFFSAEQPPREAHPRAPGEAAELSAEEKSRILTGGGLSESDRFLFAAFAEERSFAAESLIFREGESAGALYAIGRGRVRISREIAGGEEAFAILGPGEIFGEMAILDPAASGRSADARTHEAALLLVLTRARFEGLEKSDPDGCADLSELLSRVAARRCVETAERLARWRMLAGPG